MVTNYGLEAQKTVNPLLSGSIYAFGFNQVAVGTGSNAPAATDTSLQTEVARLNTVHGTDSTVVERVANSYTQIKTTLARKATFSASYTLREFGFFSTSATNTCMYRQLFRQDPNNLSSTPITIQVYAYDTLIITYTVIWRIDVSNSVNVGYTNGTFTHPAGSVGISLFPVASSTLSAAILLKVFHPYTSWNTATLVVVYLNNPEHTDVTYMSTAYDRTQAVSRIVNLTTSPGIVQTQNAQTVQKTAGATGTYSSTLKATFGSVFYQDSAPVYNLLVSESGNYYIEYNDVIATYSLSLSMSCGIWCNIGSGGRLKTSTQTWTLEWTLSWAAI